MVGENRWKIFHLATIKGFLKKLDFRDIEAFHNEAIIVNAGLPFIFLKKTKDGGQS
jgi:hypothetical protein